jgi:hypothetical protein
MLVALLLPLAVVPASAQSTVPTLIPLSGVLQTADGQPRTGNVLLILSLYAGQSDPSPSWVEHQTVTLGAGGQYEVQFGSTQADGLPAHLFAGSAAVRWVGVAVENEPEQPRVMLVSVPYASKASTADTLAGKSATEFVLSSNLADQVRVVLEEERNGGGGVTNAVSANYLAKGDGAGGTIDSNVIDLNGSIGIGTATPNRLLSVRSSGTSHREIFDFLQPATTSGSVVYGLIGRSSSFGGAAIFGHQYFSDTSSSLMWMANYGDNHATAGLIIKQGGNIGIGTTNPSAKLHVVGNAYVSGNMVVDGNIGAKYQDVAEWVDAAEPLEPGSVVVIDTTTTNRVTGATQAYDSRVAGAVSPQPGVILGEPGPGRVLVAQSGRVRIKADARYGAIKAGDLLVTSPTKGHAMRSKPGRFGGQHRPGTLIGKALEALPKGQGEILVLLTLQ